jgi:hypothetical protein
LLLLPGRDIEALVRFLSHRTSLCTEIIKTSVTPPKIKMALM